MPRKTTRHRFGEPHVAPPAPPPKPLRYTPIGSPLRLRIRRHAFLERPEMAEIGVTLIPRERELAQLSAEERTEALRAAEHLTARDFFLNRSTGDLELDDLFLRQFFTIEESGRQFQYDGVGECHTHRASYNRLEDM